MHLFETEDGDKWICVICREEKNEMIEKKNWEWIFDKDDPMLRCSLCKKPDYDYDD